ncbi:MAG: DinB family protein [Phycisphaerales bacterium]
MDPARIYQYLTLTRAKLFDWVRPLAPEQYAREFPFGYRSLRETLPHALNAEWVYAQRISQSALPSPIPHALFPVHPDQPPGFASLEAAWKVQENRTRAAIAGVTDWARSMEYTIDWDGTPMRIRATPGDVMSQLVIHEAHHRSQCMAMLRQLGVAAEDLDYSYWMYTREKI